MNSPSGFNFGGRRTTEKEFRALTEAKTKPMYSKDSVTRWQWVMIAFLILSALAGAFAIYWSKTSHLTP